MIELYKGDCLELMKDIPDRSIDMILCDPPYGTTQNAWDKVIPFEDLWEAYRRICKDNTAIVLFAQEPFTSKLIISNLKDFKYRWTWYKHQITGFLNARRQPLRAVEDIAVFYRHQCTYNPQMTKGRMQKKDSGGATDNYGNFKRVGACNDIYYPTQMLDFPTQRHKGGHPTQKPVSLLEYLIKTYTNEGETVLDNCMGSGSTGVACMNTGRSFIGMELNETYFETAKERIDKTVKGNK